MRGHKFDHLNKQFTDEIKKTLQQIIINEGYISYHLNITNDKTTAKKNINYLGNIYEINVKGKTEDGYKETCFFIKLPRQMNFSFFTIKDVFIREAYAYLELFKIFDEFQDKANVPEKERFKSVKCFDGSSSKAIIMENISKKLFKTWPRMEAVPLVLAELAIAQLAKFHALSIVLENKRPDYFKCKVKTLDYMLTIRTKENDATMKALINTSSNTLSEESKKCLAKLIGTATEEVNNHAGIAKIFKCLCHGDFKSDNFLYKDQDCGIQEVIMIDHQIIYYGSPFNDFLYFIFLDTDREFRRKHLEHLKNCYYANLEQFLKYFNLDLNYLWSREQFEKEFLDSLNFSLIRAMMVFPFTFANENSVPDLEEDIVTMDMRLDSRANDRIQDVVDDVIEWQAISTIGYKESRY